MTAQTNTTNNATACHLMKILKRRQPEEVVALLEAQRSRKRTRTETETMFTKPRRPIATNYPEKVELESAKKPTESPVEIVKSILAETYAAKKRTATGTKDRSVRFTKPTESEIDTYGEMVKAMRASDLDKLRDFHAGGAKSLDACNRFGESFIHMACRRGNLDVVSFLIDEAKVRVVRRDDYGRIPLHDAVWTTKPNFDVMDKLLATVPPSLLLEKDVRGHTCFDYARREHWGAWASFLNERKSMLQSQLEQELSETL
uniref:Uncharacterized protein n=1 Tax=Grammatophora oceanica TaxID=210454 RepID=A0A7S1UQN9_9STRA|eukprot:CAMPEP_0194049000 /NCGR_PEP_ID=MMETSP0009_2-20130614/29328_1 /TAXON_ID=210454 /ORGANISM="Grammatophora oceanica, Strain CCMP 410" /LENGTH=258 /DNA_ID=CAMNT_0038695051 /DNA_START=27 /DNA_END=803 /DNA_ORIENTATION=+